MVSVSSGSVQNTPSPKRRRSSARRMSASMRLRTTTTTTATSDTSVSSPSPNASGSAVTDGATAVFSESSSRTSQASSCCYPPPSPVVTPRPVSSPSSRCSFGGESSSGAALGHTRRKSSRASIGSVTSQYGGGGGAEPSLGNLADELAEAADAEEEDEQGMMSPSFLEGLREGDDGDDMYDDNDNDNIYDDNDNDNIYDDNDNDNDAVSSEPPARLRHQHSKSYSPTTPTTSTPRRSRSHRSKSSGQTTTATTSTALPAPTTPNMPAYDGSDYGPGSESADEEWAATASMRPLLGKRMRSIERLAHDYGDEGAVSHLTRSLHSLGPSQANVEYGVTRLLTACNSIATHRTHAQRDLFGASHALMYGQRIYGLPSVTLAELAADLDELVAAALPIPSSSTAARQNNSGGGGGGGQGNPLVSLGILVNDTNALIATLRSLTDLLQETRQATTAAARKLKSVRDVVEDLRVDDELVEHSILLIQAGDWDRRCRERQVARVCREIVRGFGERWGIDLGDTTTTTTTTTTSTSSLTY